MLWFVVLTESIWCIEDLNFITKFLPLENPMVEILSNTAVLLRDVYHEICAGVHHVHGVHE